jgi:hypothetical protein
MMPNHTMKVFAMKVFAAIVAICLLTCSSWAAVAKSDSGTPTVTTGGATTVTTSGYTVSAGSNLAIFGILTTSQDVSSVTMTWNGVSLTRIGTGISNNGRVEMFVLVNPATGTQTFTANWTTSSSAVLGLVTFSGVDQTTPYISADTATNTGTGATASVSVTSSANGATVAASGFNSATASVTATNQTTLWTNNATTTPTGASYALGGSSNSHTFTVDRSVSWPAMGIHVNEVGGGGGGSTAHTLTLTGVGK